MLKTRNKPYTNALYVILKKTFLKILSIALLSIGCQKSIENKTELSKFNLDTDLLNFKSKMTEKDTLKIFINHSVCTYQGYERIEITKKSDSLKVISEFREDTFEQNPEWKVMYEKKIPITDTLWKFENFMKRNRDRQTSNTKDYGTIQVSHNQEKIHFFSEGLSDLNSLMEDYGKTMLKLYPEDSTYMYKMVEIEMAE